MGALEVHTDEVLAPSHIDDGDDDAVLVEDRYLCFRWRESCSHEQQPGQRFIGRLGATVDQLRASCRSCVRPRTPGCISATAPMSRDLDVGGVHQRVDALQRLRRGRGACRYRRRCGPPSSRTSRRHAVSRMLATASVCTTSIGGGRRLVWINSAGRPGAIHFAPNIAAPTSRRCTPRRRDHSHAARRSLDCGELRRPAGCARRDRPARRTGATPEPTTFRLRRLPSLATAIPIHPPWTEPAVGLRHHGPAVPICTQIRRFAYDTAQSRADRT